MKTLTIRLEDIDLERIQKIQSTPYGGSTINGAIRLSLKYTERYIELMSKLNKVFKQRWIVDEKEFDRLIKEHGILQGSLY